MGQDEQARDEPPDTGDPGGPGGALHAGPPGTPGPPEVATDTAGLPEPSRGTAGGSASPLTIWSVAIGAIVVTLLLAAVVGETWLWVATVLLAVAIGAAAEAAASGKSTVLRELVLGEQDPITVTTSLEAEHLLRIASPADPYYQEVIPVTGAHRVQLVVGARSERPVVLRALRPLIVARRPTRRGEAGVTSGVLAGGHFDVLLDADPPALQPAVDAAGHVLAELPLTLPRDEPLTIVFTPRTDAYEVDWRIEIDWACAGQEGSVAVGLGGRPFRTTAETGW